MKMSYNDFNAGTKSLGSHISQRPNFSGPKKFRGPNDIEDFFSTSPKFLTPVEKNSWLKRLLNVEEIMVEKSKVKKSRVEEFMV